MSRKGNRGFGKRRRQKLKGYRVCDCGSKVLIPWFRIDEDLAIARSVCDNCDKAYIHAVGEREAVEWFNEQVKNDGWATGDGEIFRR